MTHNIQLVLSLCICVSLSMKHVTTQQPVGSLCVCMSLSLLIKMDQWVQGASVWLIHCELPNEKFLSTNNLSGHWWSSLTYINRGCKNGEFEYLHSFRIYCLEFFNNPAHSKELKAGSWRDICTPMFTAAFLIATRRKQSKCPLRDGWLNKYDPSIQWNVIQPQWGRRPCTHYNMHDPWGRYAQWSNPDTEGHTLIPFTGGP